MEPGRAGSVVGVFPPVGGGVVSTTPTAGSVVWVLPTR